MAHLGRHPRIATSAETKIGEMVKTPRPRYAPEDSVIYKIPCGEDSCKESYFGHTCRGHKKRLSEQVVAYNKRDQQIPFLLHIWAMDLPAKRRQRSFTIRLAWVGLGWVGLG